MDGRKIGSISLRLDAAYCAVAAVAVALFAPVLADVLGVSVAVVLSVATAVAVWAAVLWVGSTRFALRPMLLTVLSANVVAAISIALLALVVPDVALAIVVAAVSVEVAAFAISQAVSLRIL